MGEFFGFDFTVLDWKILCFGRVLLTLETFGLGRGLSGRKTFGFDFTVLD